jgi:HEAT repeat protein
LIETLDDEDPHVRVRAARTLGKIGAPAVTNLVTALGNEKALVRLGAAKALGTIGGEAKVAEGALAKMTNDANGEVRQAAARALSEIRK